MKNFPRRCCWQYSFHLFLNRLSGVEKLITDCLSTMLGSTGVILWSFSKGLFGFHNMTIVNTNNNQIVRCTDHKGLNELEKCTDKHIFNSSFFQEKTQEVYKLALEPLLFSIVSVSRANFQAPRSKDGEFYSLSKKPTTNRLQLRALTICRRECFTLLISTWSSG